MAPRAFRLKFEKSLDNLLKLLVLCRIWTHDHVCQGMPHNLIMTKGKSPLPVLVYFRTRILSEQRSWRINWTKCNKKNLECYAEIRHSDWLKLVVRLASNNHSTLLQQSHVTLKFVYDIYSRWPCVFVVFYLTYQREQVNIRIM